MTNPLNTHILCFAEKKEKKRDLYYRQRMNIELQKNIIRLF